MEFLVNSQQNSAYRFFLKNLILNEDFKHKVIHKMTEVNITHANQKTFFPELRLCLPT